MGIGKGITTIITPGEDTHEMPSEPSASTQNSSYTHIIQNVPKTDTAPSIEVKEEQKNLPGTDIESTEPGPMPEEGLQTTDPDNKSMTL